MKDQLGNQFTLGPTVPATLIYIKRQMVIYHNAFYYYYLRFMIMNPNNHPDSLWGGGFGMIFNTHPQHGYMTSQVISLTLLSQ